MNKNKLSLLIKKLFLRLGVYGLLRRLFPNPKIAVLRYHAVVEAQDNFYTSPPIALSPAEFERHVQYFAKKYTVLSLDEAVDYLKRKETPPSNSVVFTFDDGYADNLPAARILKKYGANGTFFITTNPIGRECRLWLSEVTYLILKTSQPTLAISFGGQNHPFHLTDTQSRWKAIRALIKIIKSNNRSVRENILVQLREQFGEGKLLAEVEDLILTWDQLKEMAEMGMVIGSHTLTHLNLPNAEPEDAVKEIAESKVVLEKKLGKKIRHFSYPNSGPYEYFNERIRQYVIDSNYESSCTSKNGFLDHNSDLFALERVRTVPELAEVAHEMEWDRILER